MTISQIISGVVPYLLQGMAITISVSFFALVIGLIVGMIFAMLRVYTIKPVKMALVILGTAARAIPQLVLLMLLYFAIAGSINISAYWAGTVSLAIISSAYQMEIFRGALESVDSGQMMAARSIGMSKLKAIMKIILPQAIRSAIPSWSNEASIVIKSSALVYAVGVQEMMRMAQYRNAKLHEPFVIYFTVALLYLALTFTTNRLLKVLENKLRLPEN